MPSDDTREAACKTAYYAYFYALLVTNVPGMIPRGCCKDSYFAYLYALEVDQCPRMILERLYRSEWAYMCMQKM